MICFVLCCLLIFMFLCCLLGCFPVTCWCCCLAAGLYCCLSVLTVADCWHYVVVGCVDCGFSIGLCCFGGICCWFLLLVKVVGSLVYYLCLVDAIVFAVLFCFSLWWLFDLIVCDLCLFIVLFDFILISLCWLGFSW